MSFCLGVENHPKRSYNLPQPSRRKQLKRASSAKRSLTHRSSTISSARKTKPRNRPKCKTVLKRADTLKILVTKHKAIIKNGPIRYGACLPLYEQLSSREHGRRMFPHFYTKQRKIFPPPLDRLDLLSTATQHSGGHANVFMAKLLRQYLLDKGSFRSIADFAVLKLNELEAISHGTRIPNRIRTAICCDLLESVVASEASLANNVLLERLKIELYRSIYGDNDFLLNETTIVSRTSAGSQPPPPRHRVADTSLWFALEPFFSRLDRVSKDAQQSAHFDHVAAQRVNQRQMDALSTGMSALGDAGRAHNKRTSLQRRAFLGWKHFAGKQLKLQRDIFNRIEHNKLRQSLRQRRLFFHDWHGAVVQRKLGALSAAAAAFEEKYNDTLRSSVLLLKKNAVLEFEVATLKKLLVERGLGAQGRGGPGGRAMDVFSEMKLFQMELKVLAEKLVICKRELYALQTDEALVYGSVLLSAAEVREHADLLALREEEVVRRWVNYQLRAVGVEHATELSTFTVAWPSAVRDFKRDFADCSVLLLLLHRLRGDEHLDFSKLQKCRVPAKRKEVCRAVALELRAFVAEGVVLFRDLLTNREDIVLAVLIALMQRAPMLHFNEESAPRISTLYAEIDMTVKKLSQQALPNQLEPLKALMQRAETILNKADNFKKAVLRSHQKWLSVLSKLQLKAIAVFSQRRVGRSLLIRSASLGQGQGGDEAEQAMWLPFSKLRHLMHSADAEHDASSTERMRRDLVELRRCEAVLNRCHHGIAQSFEFYASQDADSGLFSLDEAKLWLKDCRLNEHKALSEKILRKAIVCCTMSVEQYLKLLATPQKKARSELLSRRYGSGAENELNLIQFFEFLVRVSLKMYGDAAARNATASQKLELLLEMHVIPYSQSGDELRDRILSAPMTAMLASLEKPLTEAFMFYAEPHGAEGALLSVESFVLMLEELQLLGSAFTKVTVKSIFRRAQYQQHDDAPSAALHNLELMRYGPFVESLVVVALYKKPDPYLALQTRVEEFLVHSIINPLFHKKRISSGVKKENAFKNKKAASSNKKKKGKRKLQKISKTARRSNT